MLSGKTHKYVWALVLPVILNLGLNLVLIPKFELMGAVWATIISYSLAIIIATILARRDYPLPVPVKAAVQITICSALMAVTVLNLPLDGMTPGFVTLVIKGATGVSVYLIGCLILNIANCRDLIRDLISKFTSRSIVEVAE